jgi:2-polyprenyl-3-methyl-5-hydroxy-6-metoxy-1,4-benzoquinol methylase
MSYLQVPQTERDARREAWNVWVENNARGYYPDNVGRGETALRLLRSLGLRDPSILEVGCANGWLSTQLAYSGKFTGLDVADRAIAEARARYPQLRFICSDFLGFDFLDEKFDVVVSIDVIPYFDDQHEFVDRVAEVLTARGHLILIAPNRFVWDRTRFSGQMRGKVPSKWPYMREVKALLRDKFVLLHSETIIPGGNMGMLRLVNSHKINRVIDKLIGSNRVTRLKEKTGLGKSLVVLARKRN